jgi:hypothetical protein
MDTQLADLVVNRVSTDRRIHSRESLMTTTPAADKGNVSIVGYSARLA